MYNRYTPKQDGTFQRDRLPDSRKPAKPDGQRPAPQVSASPPCPPPRPEQPPQAGCGSAANFLSGLLPANMDAGDLLMILILLLLLSDGSDNAPSALLTIALFFLMN